MSMQIYPLFYLSSMEPDIEKKYTVINKRIKKKLKDKEEKRKGKIYRRTINQSTIA